MAYLREKETISTFSRDIVAHLEAIQPNIKEEKLNVVFCPSGFLLEDLMNNEQLKKMGAAKAIATVTENSNGSVIEISYEADQIAYIFWGCFAIFAVIWEVGAFISSVKASLSIGDLLGPLVAFALLTVVQISIFKESVKRLKAAINKMLVSSNVIRAD